MLNDLPFQLNLLKWDRLRSAKPKLISYALFSDGLTGKSLGEMDNLPVFRQTELKAVLYVTGKQKRFKTSPTPSEQPALRIWNLP